MALYGKKRILEIEHAFTDAKIHTTNDHDWPHGAGGADIKALVIMFILGVIVAGMSQNTCRTEVTH